MVNECRSGRYESNRPMIRMGILHRRSVLPDKGQEIHR